MKNTFLASVLGAFLLLLMAQPSYAQRCSSNSDCDSGEACVADMENPIVVEECTLWIFCNTSVINPLVCQVIPEAAPDPDREGMFIGCLNDIGVVRGFCALIKYYLDPDSTQEEWKELLEIWGLGARARS